jgi:hypothetical protein
LSFSAISIIAIVVTWEGGISQLFDRDNDVTGIAD